MIVGLSRTISPISLLFLLCCAGFARPAVAEPVNPDSRGKAMVMVVADLLSASPVDRVSIHIVNNTDKTLLTGIAQALGTKLKAAPAKLKFEKGDPRFVDDKGIGLDFDLPVVPRGESFLPIAPFIEAFAPHVSHLRIVYYLQGPFDYKGYERYEEKGASFTVDPPETPSTDSNVPLAFYGVNVIIKNPALTTMSVPNYPTAPGARRGLSTLMLGLLIGMAVMAIGIILALMLSRWQASAKADEKKA
ncbi:MAG: hypothetical protein ACYC7E_14700 [Armatimonadota bacterium]